MHKWICVVALLGACGDDGPGGVTSTKLTGFWNTEAAYEHTVFGFVAAEHAAATIEPTDPMWPAGVDLATVYVSVAAGMDLRQISTYEVVDGELVQTVIGDVQAPPGTMYGTKIIAFDGDTLTLESTNDPSGMRTYTRSDRCPSENNQGWRLGGMVDFIMDPNYHSPAIAIDDTGRVYSLLGQIADTATAFPRFTDLGDGCVPLLEVVPMFRQVAMTLVGAEIHSALELMAIGNADDSKLVHRWRANRTAPWQVEDIAPPPTGTPPQNGSPMYSLHLFAEANGLVAIASRTNGVLEVYRKDVSGWHPVTLSTTDTRRVEDAAIGTNGDIALMTLGSVMRLRGTQLEIIPLPKTQLDNGVNGGVRVDDDGAIHAVYGHTVASNSGFVAGLRTAYGVYDGTWTETELGPMMYAHVLMPRDGKRRVIAGEVKNALPPLAMIEIAADGSMTSQRINVDDPGGTSPPSYARFAVAEGKDGTVAVSFNAKYVWVRHPTPARAPRMIPFRAQITGQGRVFTDDGRIDCTQTCTTVVPEGTRLPIKLEAPAGHVAYDNACAFGDAHTVEGYCWHDAVPAGPGTAEAIATFVFQ